METPLGTDALGGEKPEKGQYSGHIVYVDESGDHNLDSVDGKFPLFVLAFCIFGVSEYIHQVIPAFTEMKFRYFGHESVIFHERDIRKRQGAFGTLSESERTRFLGDLNTNMEAAPFKLIVVVIRKDQLKTKYPHHRNPYHLAMDFGLERCFLLLKRGNNHKGVTHFICENRGPKEDKDLELEFRRYAGGHNSMSRTMDFDVRFADKKTNLVGLQIADLAARPVGIHVLRPSQPNRSFGILERKFDRSPDGRIAGFGLKVFP